MANSAETILATKAVKSDGETRITTDIESLLGSDGKSLLAHQCKTISRDALHLPGPDFVDRVYALSDRQARVLRSLQQMFDHGRLARTGYLSILPVD